MGIEPDGDDRVASPLQTPLHVPEVGRSDSAGLRTLTLGLEPSTADPANGGASTVVINDRGPFDGRVIDLSDDAVA